MKVRFAVLTCQFMICSIAPVAFAADVKIIANESVAMSSLSAEDLKGIFLMTKARLSDGSRPEPVLVNNGQAHETFLKEYLGKNDAGLTAYYRSLVFSGKGSMPKTVNSEEEVVAYVAKTKGAIGYVAADAKADGVKTLEVK